MSYLLPAAAARRSALVGLIMALAIAGLLEVMTTPGGGLSGCQTVLRTGVWWRIPVLAFAFFVIYLAAGVSIHPWIASFYAHRQLPTIIQLLRLQLFRGVLDISCVYPMYWQWMKSRKRVVWVSACVFSLTYQD